ncbi:LMxysn_1693 family intestinal colonization protein [Listeria seeligeri]|uniref:LMxysn_1693 family intestinal colonization protein n=1 Tax=Listeria seeligeri TaxID=1640 RepID=UPI001888FB1F|nr:hypothetical protein [Listeria seeligeri]MBF2458337.1 hypothetical protein [Listeria seeligeri]MBF2548759.1 hypothetical protein [Listeria seeligeri]
MKTKKGKFMIPLMASTMALTTLLPATSVFAKEENTHVTNAGETTSVSVTSTQGTHTPVLYEATGFHYKTISKSIKKTKRVYLGKKKVGNAFGITVKFKKGPLNINVYSKHYESGYYKKYRQYAKITVKVKKYANGSGRYVGTYTYSSNTSYLTYVPV